MTIYQGVPLLTFLGGSLFTAITARERLKRLTSERNLHAHKAATARREQYRAEAERDALAATLAARTDGGSYLPMTVGRDDPVIKAAMEQHPVGKGVIRFPRQAKG